MFEFKDLPYDVKCQLTLFIKGIAKKEGMSFEDAYDKVLTDGLLTPNNSFVIGYLGFLNYYLEKEIRNGLPLAEAKEKTLEFAGSFEQYVEIENEVRKLPSFPK